jgi:glycosyltransferase involved in cell wall biosynthesis
VVGGERPGPGQDWYSRVIVPDHCKPYPSFIRWLREQRVNWDIALAPLVDDPFNAYKSDLKYLEYAALGLPGVYADLVPYSTVDHGRTGLKVDGSTGAWAAAISSLAADPSLRDQLAAAAFEEVVSTRLLHHGAQSLLELICGVAERPA